MEPVPSVYYDGYVQNQLQDVVIAIQSRLDEFKKAAEISGITLSLVNEQNGETTDFFRLLQASCSKRKNSVSRLLTKRYEGSILWGG